MKKINFKKSPKTAKKDDELYQLTKSTQLVTLSIAVSTFRYFHVKS